MRCLVTGASGYVGGRLVPRLLAAGYEVRCLTRSAAEVARILLDSAVPTTVLRAAVIIYLMADSVIGPTRRISGSGPVTRTSVDGAVYRIELSSSTT